MRLAKKILLIVAGLILGGTIGEIILISISFNPQLSSDWILGHKDRVPDPDILIRTGNTNRLSNFLLWQLSYSEIFFVKKLWPDFNKNDFNKILIKFKKIKRNYGKI